MLALQLDAVAKDALCCLADNASCQSHTRHPEDVWQPEAVGSAHRMQQAPGKCPEGTRCCFSRHHGSSHLLFDMVQSVSTHCHCTHLGFSMAQHLGPPHGCTHLVSDVARPVSIQCQCSHLQFNMVQPLVRIIQIIKLVRRL